MKDRFVSLHAAIGAGTITQDDLQAALIDLVREFHAANGPDYPADKALEFGFELMNLRDHWAASRAH